MRQVNVIKFPLKKRLKLLFTNKLYLVMSSSQQGPQVEVGPDKPEDVVTMTHNQIDIMIDQAQQLAIEQFKQFVAEQSQDAQQPPEDPKGAAKKLEGVPATGQRPVDTRGPVPVKEPVKEPAKK